MKVGRIFFVIATILCLGLGLAGFVYMTVLEHQARQELPPEMRTPEAIQMYYDGAVCLICDISRIFIAFFSIGLGSIILLCWGIYEALIARQKPLESVVGNGIRLSAP